MNVAPMVVLLLSVSEHIFPEGVHPALQLENIKPVAGVAVRTIGLPAGKVALQVELTQSIPAGELITMPLPVICTVRVALVPKPGHPGVAALSTVTVAKAITVFPPGPVPRFSLAEIWTVPQPVPLGAATPVLLMVATCWVLDCQVTWSVIGLVAGG